MTLTPQVPIRLITTSDVRASIKRAKQSLEKAAGEIVWQIEMEAWRTLGYSSWNAMREAEYGEAAFMVPRKDRPELQSRMKRAGLTNSEIAATMGVGQRTVERETAKWRNDHPDEPVPTITNARGQERPATYARGEPSPAADEFCKRCGADANGCTCQHTPNATTDPAPAESVAITVTCPTCHGTGKVTR